MVVDEEGSLNYTVSKSYKKNDPILIKKDFLCRTRIS